MYCFEDIGKVLEEKFGTGIKQAKGTARLMRKGKEKSFSGMVKEIADNQNIELRECILGDEYTLKKCKECVYNKTIK